MSANEGRSNGPASDVVLERALRAVGLTRALGLHFHGHFVGIAGKPPVDGVARLELEGEPPGVGTLAVSPVALVTVADLAIGAAIRSRLWPGARLGTATLSVQHPVGDVAGPLVADATTLWVRDNQGTGRCTVSAAGEPVAQAQGWFAALPAPRERDIGLMPWEYAEPPAVEPPRLEDLDEREAAAVAAARAAGERAEARGTAVSEELLVFEWQESEDGRASGTLRIGPELGNRVGHVQGGALYGAAALAATQALGAADAVLSDGYYQFLRPADGSILVGEGAVVRRGRSAAFVESRLFVDDAIVGAGLFAFRLANDRPTTRDQ